MNTALYVPNFGSWGDPTAMVTLATDAEASGWDGFFVWDHIGGFENAMADPWVALGAVAHAQEALSPSVLHEVAVSLPALRRGVPH